MARLMSIVLVTFLFISLVSAHPGHRNKKQQLKGKVQEKKVHHAALVHRHQPSVDQEAEENRMAMEEAQRHQPSVDQEAEENRMAMEEAQKVLQSLDDLSSAVKRVSLATENGISYRGNEISDEQPSRPRPFLMNILKNVFKDLHRVQSTYQDDSPRFSTNFNNSIYQCTKDEEASEAHAFSSMYLPKEVMIFADETNQRSVVMETHGLVTEEELSIYSVIRGKLVDLDMLIPSLQLLEDPLVKLPSQVKPDDQVMDGRQEPEITTSQRPPLIVTVGEAVGDYMFRTVHALLSRMIHNMEDGHAVSALLRCEMDSIECLVDQRYDATGLRMCTSTLCKCMDSHLPEIGSVLRPTFSPKDDSY